MLSARNIHKTFNKVQILKGIDIDAGEAEIVSIVGPSGAGKTTLLQILGTLEQADHGTVTIDGTDISALGKNGIADFRNRMIGFVFWADLFMPSPCIMKTEPSSSLQGIPKP